ncbi:MAG: DNA gyrase inhibitor YacG [Myxococcales bacterium]|nr:DNA gyrase inhibitor YacG [Myxococcales bacterium]
MTSNEKIAECPICEKDVPPRTEGSAYPFCSARCQLIDLGQWLDGKYTVPGSPNFDD